MLSREKDRVNGSPKYFIVLVQPGANAHFVRRLQGIGFSIGCQLEVVQDLSKVCAPLGPSTLILPVLPSIATDGHPDLGQFHRVVEYSDQIKATQTPTANKWLGIGNPLTSPHATAFMQHLTRPEHSPGFNIQTGWSTLNFSASCTAKQFQAKLEKSLLVINTETAPNSSIVRSAAEILAKKVTPTTKITMSLHCDGNSWGFQWTVHSCNFDLTEVADLFKGVDNSMHTLTTFVDDQRGLTNITGRYLLCPEGSTSRGLVILGTSVLTAAVPASRPRKLGRSA
jgi:hypothetical protein